MSLRLQLALTHSAKQGKKFLAYRKYYYLIAVITACHLLPPLLWQDPWEAACSLCLAQCLAYDRIYICWIDKSVYPSSINIYWATANCQIMCYTLKMEPWTKFWAKFWARSAYVLVGKTDQHMCGLTERKTAGLRGLERARGGWCCFFTYHRRSLWEGDMWADT